MTHYSATWIPAVLPTGSALSTIRPMIETKARVRRFDRPLVWWSAAGAALILGFADLARGGETIAPILLVLGYIVLVPLAIMRS